MKRCSLGRLRYHGLEFTCYLIRIDTRERCDVRYQNTSDFIWYVIPVALITYKTNSEIPENYFCNTRSSLVVQGNLRKLSALLMTSLPEALVTCIKTHESSRGCRYLPSLGNQHHQTHIAQLLEPHNYLSCVHRTIQPPL